MDVFGSLEADPEVLVSLRCLGLVLKILWLPSSLNSVNRVKSYGLFSVFCPERCGGVFGSLEADSVVLSS